ncbi:MAG: hypothetical protein JWM76_3243 [Pseudonocardiales bacterium]|nr:hypothetical protein [Pseudonocardiales bacterium]
MIDTKLEVSSYVVTDDFFGAPYLDVDEERNEPTPHRHIHGGFEGTSTRFTFYLPPSGRYQGRLFQPLEGGNAGHEDINAGALGAALGRVEMIFRLGGYVVESNMGHIGDVMDPKAGTDPTIYGWRAAAESARLSKYIAEQALGAAPRYSYVFGGSGGARRSPLCLAYAPDVWDGALPYMGDAMDGEHGDHRRLRGGGANFSSMFNVQRLLGPKILDVVDAMAPGGSKDPFAGLGTHEREELANLYRIGFPRGDETMIAQPMGQIWLWSSMAERLRLDYPQYWEAFWSQPGHVGHDQPEVLERDLIDTTARVVRPLLAKEILEGAEFQGDEFAAMRGMVFIFASMFDMWEKPMVLELDHLPPGYLLGAGVRAMTGEGAGRQLYCINGVGNFVMCDGEGEASNARFEGVAPGDEVRLDNRGFLAFCYYYRHHLLPSAEWDFLRVDGRPVYPQYELPEMSPFMGTVHSAEYQGKLMWVHHTHDSSLWPSQGIGMKNNVERLYGVEGAAKKFRLRWTENAEHGQPGLMAPHSARASNTWLVDPDPVIEQCLADLTSWVEDGIEPEDTNFEYQDGTVRLPATAARRRGIQPVVTVTANDSTRANVSVGEAVSLRVRAEVLPAAGTIISVAWDFDGSGAYPFRHDVDGTSSEVTLSTTHSFDRPGTYFATALVESHRDGDVAATSRRIPNLASARVVVSATAPSTPAPVNEARS